MKVDDLSLSALRTLCTVHDLGSFSRAADALGKGQSSVSYAIAEMRRAFNDPLFVRQGAGIAATERCDEIVATAREVIERMEELGQSQPFDPATTEGHLRLSCNYYERATVLPAVLRRLRQAAPGLTLDVFPALAEGAQQLKSGQADLFISPMTLDGTDLFAKRLFADRYVVVMDAANPAAQDGALDFATYTRLPHVQVTYGVGWRSFYIREVEERGGALNTVLSVPSSSGLEELIVGTDLIATVPARAAQISGQGLAIFDSPCPAPFEVSLFWSRRTQAAPMMRWVREQIVEAMR